MRQGVTASTPVTTARNRFDRFSRQETGGITAFGILLFISVAAISAAALDVSRLMSARSQLQNAVDASAHAALYLRERFTSTEAIQGALDIVEAEMPFMEYGLVVDGADVVFGHWDDGTMAFTPDPTSRDAVMVSARLGTDRMNAVESFLFKIVGVNSFDMGAVSVYETFRPSCLREGFVAQGVVDVQSNNYYGNGFCVHSNSHVSLNSNSTFEDGTVISMPDPANLDVPSSGFESNDGLMEALDSSPYRLRILNQLDDIMQAIEDGDSNYLPDYISGSGAVMITAKNGQIGNADIVPGRLHEYSCNNSNGTLTITSDPGVPITEFALVTNCKIKFGQGAQIEDALIVTHSTSDKSVTAPSGLVVGRDDSCADGGGAQILTKGGMEFASALSLYGAQLIAQHDITFSANADGIEGASVIAGGEISGTSSMAMGFCGSGMDNIFEADYFRMRL